MELKQFIKNNWFKLSVIIVALVYLFILFLNFYLEAKRYNLSVHKDSIKSCYDLVGRYKDQYSICKKAMERYSLNPTLFISDELQKQYEREKAFWNCYGDEWNKSNNSEEASKYCSQEADKILK